MLFASSCLGGCTTEQHSSQGAENVEVDASDQELWDKTVSQYLQDELWIERDAYDAGHYLMIPLHAAFYFDEEKWQKQFSNHFSRFMDASKEEPEKVVEGRLNRLHYLYLASRFVVLAEESDKSDLIPHGLVEILQQEVEKIWAKEPAWQWDMSPFSGGMKERVEWKLKNKDVPKSYYRAIIDEELFVFSIAADLRSYERLTKPEQQWADSITDILKVAYKTFQQEGKFQNDEGWLFQPGVWTDHPDYAYAGHMKKQPSLKPKPVLNIAGDTSYSHRFPLWLTSLAGAYEKGEPENVLYCDIKRALEKQFYEKALVKPENDFPAYRTTNFMDGHNGLYRWGYQTTGKNNGYGPYELSGTLILGWWTFLDTDRIRDMYKYMAEHFPLPENVIAVYVGPNTTRERHWLVRMPDTLNNGFAELIARLASKLQGFD